MDVDLTGSLPAVSGLSPDALLDPSTAYLSRLAYHEPDNKGTMLAGNLDLEYRASDDGFLRKITVGARAAKRKQHDNFRSEARRVGKACVRTFRSRWSPYH